MSNNNISRSTLIHHFSSISEFTCIYSFILFACWNADGIYQIINPLETNVPKMGTRVQ